MRRIFFWGMAVVLGFSWLGKTYAAESSSDSYSENTRYKVSFTPSQNENRVSQGARNLKPNSLKKIDPPHQPSLGNSRLKPKHENDRLKPKHSNNDGTSRLKPKHKNDRLKPKHSQVIARPLKLDPQPVSQLGSLKTKGK